jgi:hypothetical protein
MKIEKDMGTGEMETDRSSETTYDDEVMCAGWNPDLVAVRLQEVAASGQHQEVHPMPADLAAVDVDAFLKKVYRFQR